jgi:hypothetical protein
MINSVKFGAINLQDYNTTSYNKYYHLDINKHTVILNLILFDINIKS